MNLLKHRRWYYLFSALIILPGVISMIISLVSFGQPFRLSIDFTGGSLWELRFAQAVAPGEIVRVFQENGVADVNVNTIGDPRTLAVRSSEIDPDTKAVLLGVLTAAFGGEPEELQFRAVGPTIGREVTRTAFIAVALASVAILAFIIWLFEMCPIRCVLAPPPSWPCCTMC